MSLSSVLNRFMKNAVLWQLKMSATCLLFQLSITPVSIHLITHNHSLSSLYADAATMALEFYIFYGYNILLFQKTTGIPFLIYHT